MVEYNYIDPFEEEKCYADNPFIKRCDCKKCRDKNPFMRSIDPFKDDDK